MEKAIGNRETAALEILISHSYLILECLKDPAAHISDAGGHFIKIQSNTSNAFANFPFRKTPLPIKE